VSERTASATRARRTPFYLHPIFWSITLCITLGAYAWRITVPERAAVFPSLLLELLLWTGILIALVLRHPRHELRMSEPTLTVLGWMFYYFIKPTLSWLEGRRFMFESSSTVILEPEIVARVQQLHMLFMVGFFGAYLVFAPRIIPTPIAPEERTRRLPKVWPFVVVGLLPYVIEVGGRIIATGSILPSKNYGDATFESFDALTASRAAGGADYLLTQILSKLWFFPLASLGLGYGIVLARLITRSRWALMMLFFAQVPLLFILGTGSRSYAIFPFLMAVMIADVLAGPFRWRYFMPLVIVGLPVVEFYGIFRGHQELAIRDAVSASQEQIASEADMVNTEDSGMLVKEAFCVLYVDHTRQFRGLEYFVDSVLMVLPAQIVPDKAQIMVTSTFLSDVFLGFTAARGAGFAGTAIGDGYMIAGEIGVLGLAGVMGGIFALVMRFGASGDGVSRGPLAWRYLYALLFAAQVTQYIRADLSLALSYLLYFLLVPFALVRAFEGTLISATSFWMDRLPIYRRAVTSPLR
jgi:hypothetical protein